MINYLRVVLYKNRKKILVTIFAIIGVLIILRVLDNYSLQKRQDDMNRSKTALIEEKVLTKNYIIKFIEYCNKKEESNAYELLSSKCKLEVYPTLEKFIQEYCNIYFGVQKEYEIIMDDNHYQITLTDDRMSTGKLESDKIIQIFQLEYEEDDIKIYIEV